LGETILYNRPVPIFLFSLPRSGSTLCQRILATHNDIKTVNEPHILLPFLYALKHTGIYSEYNHKAVSYAMRSFCRQLIGGEETYLSQLREFVIRLYGLSSGENTRYFLDKTPKYNLVAQDIFNLFPDAKYIVLWRNPLAVISSVMQTWNHGHWNLHHLNVEIYSGLENLITAYRKESHRVCAIQYEKMIKAPEETWRTVFDYLEIPFTSSVIKNFSNVKFEGRFFDPNSQLKPYQVITQAPLNKWRKLLANPLRKAWCRRYLRWIGEERLKIMGYELDSLLRALNELPSTGRYLFSDVLMTVYGAISHVIEPRMMRHKFQALRSGDRMYMHK